MSIENKEITESCFTSPGMYCITVRGAIDERYSGYFGDMKISSEEQAGNKPLTTLTGELKDQSALVGVLNALYGLHLTILSIKTIN